MKVTALALFRQKLFQFLWGLCLLFSLPQVAASTLYNWSWSGGDFSAVGSFETSVKTGTITENDVTSHDYKVFENGTLMFEIDLLNGLLNGSSVGVVVNFHDFEYAIGSDRFNQVNSDVSDPDFPVDFTLGNDNDEYYGLSYDPIDNDWDLNDGALFEVVSTAGFSSGPIISTVTVPATFWLIGAGLIGFFGVRKRALTVL